MKQKKTKNNNHIEVDLSSENSKDVISKIGIALKNAYLDRRKEGKNTENTLEEFSAKKVFGSENRHIMKVDPLIQAIANELEAKHDLALFVEANRRSLFLSSLSGRIPTTENEEGSDVEQEEDRPFSSFSSLPEFGKFMQKRLAKKT